MGVGEGNVKQVPASIMVSSIIYIFLSKLHLGDFVA